MSGGRGAKNRGSSIGVRWCLPGKRNYISICELCILGHSTLLYLLFVKSFIVAYDGQLRITLIRFVKKSFSLLKKSVTIRVMFGHWGKDLVASVLNRPLLIAKVVLRIFTLALIVTEILPFQIFDHQQVDQGQGI